MFQEKRQNNRCTLHFKQQYHTILRETLANSFTFYCAANKTYHQTLRLMPITQRN